MIYYEAAPVSLVSISFLQFDHTDEAPRVYEGATVKTSQQKNTKVRAQFLFCMYTVQRSALLL